MSSSLLPLRIVIADDDTDDHYFIKKAITELNSNAECCPVYNGLQLMNFLTGKNGHPELTRFPYFILLDINMPLLDGLQALERLKADAKLKHIPVFIMSTSALPAHEKKAMQLGAAGFYIKPIELSKLKETISEIFNKLKSFK